ncbi:MAG: chaperone activity ATPase ATP-binding subunit, partial [bacterium]
SVILFDEFEKAHPLFFDLLLQVLGEGRLTDSAGKLADFRNSVVIMTSNLGAEAFQKGSMGFQTGDLANATKYFVRAVKDFLRPELFNRIDRIVPFTPLTPKVIQQIAVRELEKLKQRSGIQFRNITLEYSNSIAQHLAEKGYSPRYGARPLKRTIERELLVPLSEKLNSYSADMALAAGVSLTKEAKLQVSVQPRVDKHGRPIPALATNNSLSELIKESSSISYNTYSLEHSTELMDIQNEIFRLTKLEEKLKHILGWKNPQDLARLARLPGLRKVFEDCKTLCKKAFTLEDNLSLAFYGKKDLNKNLTTVELYALSKEWQEVLLSTYALKFSNPNYVTLAFYSENPKRLFEMANMYFLLASKQEAKIEVFKLTVDKEAQKTDKTPDSKKALKKQTKEKQSSGKNQEDDSENKDKEENKATLTLKRQLIDKPQAFFKSPQDAIFSIVLGIDAFSIVLGIDASWSYLYYATESGTHAFLQSGSTETCFIDSSEVKPTEYLPPASVKRNTQTDVKKQSLRREWDFDKGMVEDMVLKKKTVFYRNTIPDDTDTLINERLLKVAKAAILQQED